MTGRDLQQVVRHVGRRPDFAGVIPSTGSAKTQVIACFAVIAV